MDDKVEKPSLPTQPQDEPASEPLPGHHPEEGPPLGSDGSFRRVYFGHVASPLVPPHPEPPESSEDDLAKAAMEDPGAAVRDIPSLRPTFWRVIFLILIAVVALTIVFWK